VDEPTPPPKPGLTGWTWRERVELWTSSWKEHGMPSNLSGLLWTVLAILLIIAVGIWISQHVSLN